MTTQESFKRRIRARMAKTGERYNAARRALLEQAQRREPTPGWVSAPGTTDDAVRAATGRGWDEWCAQLDRDGVRDAGHTAIAAHVQAAHGIDSWWSQTVTVGYERIRGLRLPYQNHDGTFTAARSKTVDVDADAVRAMLLDDHDRAALFPAFAVELRSRPTTKALRFAIADTTLEVSLAPTATGRTKVSVAHSRLSTADDVALWRQFWADWIDALDALDGPDAGRPVST